MYMYKYISAYINHVVQASRHMYIRINSQGVTI